jgi:hypothetical protein
MFREHAEEIIDDLRALLAEGKEFERDRFG